MSAAATIFFEPAFTQSSNRSRFLRPRPSNCAAEGAARSARSFRPTETSSRPGCSKKSPGDALAGTSHSGRGGAHRYQCLDPASALDDTQEQHEIEEAAVDRADQRLETKEGPLSPQPGSTRDAGSRSRSSSRRPAVLLSASSSSVNTGGKRASALQQLDEHPLCTSTFDPPRRQLQQVPSK
ncbi:hypothetical protein ON010_g12471 [Phytophthora cinnamomi]|nr:hypothetical protein ON010_g12471 [Phytophthora cinnamomi]